MGINPIEINMYIYIGRISIPSRHKLLVTIKNHPELGLELGLVENVAEEREVGGDLGRLGHREVVGQLKLVDHSES